MWRRDERRVSANFPILLRRLGDRIAVIEVFLRDWWPIRAKVRLCDRLSVMPVRIVYTADASSNAWREDWPAVPAVNQPSSTRAGSGALLSRAAPPKHGDARS